MMVSKEEIIKKIETKESLDMFKLWIAGRIKTSAEYDAEFRKMVLAGL